MVPEIALFTDRSSGKLLDVNDAAVDAYGYSRAELLMLTLDDLLAAGAPLPEASIAASDTLGGTAFETMHERKDGSRFPVEVFAHRTHSRYGAVIVSRIRDISARRNASGDILRLTQLCRSAASQDFPEAAHLHLMLADSAHAIRFGVPFVGALTRIEGNHITAEAVADASAVTVPAGALGLLTRGKRRPLAGSIAQYVDRCGTTVAWSDAAGPGQERPALASAAGFASVIATPVRIGGASWVLMFVSSAVLTEPFRDADIAFVDLIGSFFASRLQNGRLREQLRYSVDHDALTGLPNTPFLRGAVNRAIREDATALVVMVNIDNFRDLNEVHGHQTADALLVEIAAALERECEPDEMVARMGGGNFCILKRAPSWPDVEERLTMFQSVFSHPFGIGDRQRERTVRVGATFGVAVAPDDGETFEELLAAADAAAEGGKRTQRGSISFFNASVGTSFGERRELRSDIFGAIEGDQFELYYQPTIAVDSGALTGAEALIRWRHPTRGLLLPGAFIEFAERNALIRQIDRWVMERTIADLAALGPLPPDFRCYFNVSPGALDDPAFAARLATLLASNEPMRDHVGVELTERAAMVDARQTMKSLEALRKLGVSVAIDDFGTGYSSLSYLRRFAVDVIKVDQSFVRGIDRNAQDASLVATILQISRNFGCRSLAEGVESAAELAWLRANGCNSAQGFHIARPMPAGEFALVLKAGSPSIGVPAAVAAPAATSPRRRSARSRG